MRNWTEWYVNWIILFGFLGYQDSDAKIKIHQFSYEKSSFSGEVLFEPLMEDFKLMSVEKKVQKMDVNIPNIFRNFSPSRIGSKEKTHALKAQG